MRKPSLSKGQLAWLAGVPKKDRGRIRRQLLARNEAMTRSRRSRRKRIDEPFMVVWSSANDCFLAYIPAWRTTIDGETLEEARKKARDLLVLLDKKPDDEAGDRLIEKLRGRGKAIDFRHASDDEAVARARAEIARAVTIATDPDVLAFLERRRKLKRKTTQERHTLKGAGSAARRERGQSRIRSRG